MAITDSDLIIKSGGEFLKRVWTAWNFAKNTEVLVGIPEETSARNGGLSNAQLLYIHSNGSPINHLPARPVIEPAIMQSDVKSQLQEHMRAGLRKVIVNMDVNGGTKEYKIAGVAAVNAVNRYITSGNLAPLAPITINGGWMRNHSTGKVFHVKGKGGKTTPLIDTGSLRKSITWVIREKGKTIAIGSGGGGGASS